MSELKCPKCRRPISQYGIGIQHPQYECCCSNLYGCTFKIDWWKRKDAFVKLTQEEINQYYKENEEWKT